MSFSFDKTGVAKVVELAKIDGLLAEARADGSFFELPEDFQLMRQLSALRMEAMTVGIGSLPRKLVGSLRVGGEIAGGRDDGWYRQRSFANLSMSRWGHRR